MIHPFYAIGLVGITSLLCSNAVIAKSYQSHDSIYKAARMYMLNNSPQIPNGDLEVIVGKLDSRLRIKQCALALKSFKPKGSRTLGKTTVGVKCTDEKPWSLHVPVTINLYKNVMVAAREMQRGDVIAASDIKLAKHNLAELSYGYFDDLKHGIGMKLKRRSTIGSVITPTMLKKQQIIKRGQQVVIHAKLGRMRVRMIGKALSNGAVGERIKVENISSKQKLEGVITPTGEIKVEI